MKNDDDASLKDRWSKRIAREIKAHKKFHDQAKRSEKAFLDETAESADSETTAQRTLFPIWWSTVSITAAAIYAKSPKPDVRRRNASQDRNDDLIATAIERALTYSIDNRAFDDHSNRVVGDYLIGGLGIGKVELKTTTGKAPVIDPLTQAPMLDAKGEPILQKMILKQYVCLRHFHWSKFGWEPGKDWESCDWIRFRHDLTADEIEERFGVEIDNRVDVDPKGNSLSPKKQYKETLEVDEIWDKKTKRQIFITEDWDTPLEVNDDPLHLEDFYPCPKPIMTNVASDELVPKPDYCFVEMQCKNINAISGRIHSLTRQVKDVGFYDAQLLELAQLQDAEDGARVPIKNLMERLNKATKGDFDQVMAVQDNQGRVNTLSVLIQQRDIEKNVVFETLGISDIIRGSSVASETAEAQKIKAQWGNVRIGPKIRGIAGFFRDIFRLYSELIAEHFDPEQINNMTAMELSPEQIATMKDDMARCYAIDIETDSTIAADDSEERNQRMEMVKGMTDYLGVYLPWAQQNMIPAETVKQTMLFILQSFKYGRALEDTIAQMPDNQQQLQGLQQQLQEQQQQLEQATAQAQQLQAQLAEVDQADQQVKQTEANAKANLQDKQAEKTVVETELLRQSAAAESAVADQASTAAVSTVHASMSLEQAMQQLIAIMPALQGLVAQATAPKAKAGRMWRNPDGTHSFAVDEVQEEAPAHEMAESPIFEQREDAAEAMGRPEPDEGMLN